jgi:hypothetical protein
VKVGICGEGLSDFAQFLVEPSGEKTDPAQAFCVGGGYPVLLRCSPG